MLLSRFKGDKLLEPSDHIVYEKEGDNYALVIKGVELKEAGKYTVTATNEVGSLDAIAKLKVTGTVAASSYFMSSSSSLDSRSVPWLGCRQHAGSKLACLALFSARLFPSSICPDSLSIIWLVSVVVFSFRMAFKW